MNSALALETLVAPAPRAAQDASAAHDTDAALMLRVKRGDMMAFEELVVRYKRPVINFVYRMLPDGAEAEDLAQTVFVQVFKSARRYKPSARFSTWLFTIARNLCLNEIRRRTRHPAQSWEALHEEQGDTLEPLIQGARRTLVTDATLRAELEVKVGAALADLPENQRAAMLLYTYEDLSYDDIAGVLGCTLSATKSLIHRARETLRARLKPYLSAGEWQE